MMIEFGCYTDPFVLAVSFNNFESVKRFLESENYNPEVLKDITKSVLGAHIPVYYISRCWEICLGHEFSESFNAIAQKNYENAKKIIALFKDSFGIGSIEIPFSKIIPACWSFEDDTDEKILYGKREDFIAKGKKAIDLDLYIAVQKMDFQKVRALLDGGANPLYRHYDDDSNLLEQCGAECSYQTTCQAGEYIKCPSLWFDSIGYDELGDLFQWAANEQMYQLLDLYVPKNDSEK